MEIRLIAAVVAQGGVLTFDGDRLVCKLPKGTQLAPEVSAHLSMHKASIVAMLTVAPLSETIQFLRSLAGEERTAWEAALAHDLAAFSALDAPTQDGAR
jgi:hypothetical protein